MGVTKKCKHCQSEIDKQAKICPVCKRKQGVRAKFIVIGIIVFFVLIASLSNGSDDVDNEAKQVAVNTNDVTDALDSTENTEVNEIETTPEPAEEPKEEAEPEAEPTISTETMGQKNALGSALSYLAYTSFSYSGLIKQLEFEEFSTEEATYAADNCGADWNEQAALNAQQYLDYSSFSRAELIKQLEYEGFTSEQAEYGATAVGY